MFVPTKNEKNKTIFLQMMLSFLRTKIDSTDFKNGNLTTKLRRNKAEKPHFKKKNIPKRLEADETIK